MQGVETRIFTVPSNQVNDELAVRQLFGWQFAQTSARSFATGAGVMGGATEIGDGVYLGAASVNVRNAHYTDLTLHRPRTPRTQYLDGLEQRYDEVTFLPPASAWWVLAIAGVVFAGGVIAWASIMMALGNGKANVSGEAFLIPLAVGLGLGLTVRHLLQRRRNAENARREALQAGILNQARGVKA